jgi:hypothetical protein
MTAGGWIRIIIGALLFAVLAYLLIKDTGKLQGVGTTPSTNVDESP